MKLYTKEELREAWKMGAMSTNGEFATCPEEDPEFTDFDEWFDSKKDGE